MHYETIRNIYNSPKCIVNEIKYPLVDLRACAKILKCSTILEHDQIFKEIINLARIRDLPLALQLYECKLTRMKVKDDGKEIEKDFISIITEYCSQGNLDMYISIRKKNEKYYSFSELKRIFFDFIQFFADLQRRDIAHRDIKPENIYVNEAGNFRVGDMGSSKIINFYTTEHTIVGTESFLSPELRRGYYMYKKRESGLHMECIPYKCDVFSLGLVFLFLIQMKKLENAEYELEGVQNMIFEAIKGVKFFFFQELLLRMLEFNQAIRPDFLCLEEYYKKRFSKLVCSSCSEDDGQKTINCSFCELAFHLHCIPSGSCPNCKNRINEKCRSCLSYHLLRCLTHYSCELCSIMNLDCINCIGFELCTGRQDNFNFPVQKFQCYSCETTLESSPEGTLVICSKCMTSWCKFCKRKAHKDISCIDNFDVLNIFCRCQRRITCLFSGIFVYCETCRISFCVVCLEVSVKSHLRCAQVLNK